MVDTLVSGASASRRVGSTPISGTIKKRNDQSGHSSFSLYRFLSVFVTLRMGI